MGRSLVEGPLDQRDVHPPVEFVRRVADGAYDLETLFRVERQPRPVVGRNAGDQGPVAEPSSLGGQLLEQGGSDPAAVWTGSTYTRLSTTSNPRCFHGSNRAQPINPVSSTATSSLERLPCISHQAWASSESSGSESIVAKV